MLSINYNRSKPTSTKALRTKVIYIVNRERVTISLSTSISIFRVVLEVLLDLIDVLVVLAIVNVLGIFALS